MQTGEPPENYYPQSRNGIVYEKSPDTWEVNLASCITGLPIINGALVTIYIYNCPTPELLIQKLKELVPKMGWKLLDGGIQYRRKLIHKASFESIYEATVTPNMQKLKDFWIDKVSEFANMTTITLLGHDTTFSDNFSIKLKAIQYAFYCWCIEQNLLKELSK